MLTSDTGEGWRQDVHQIRALQPRSILFLCVANSARSQMAEGIARHLASSDIEVHSAGSIPTSPHPAAIRALADIGIDAAGQTSKSVEDLFGISVDVVISLCRDEVCPVWLDAAARFHWPLPDPAAGTANTRRPDFVEVRNDLSRRLTALFER